MANAKRDANFVPVVLLALNTDGSTPVQLAVDPTTHSVKVSDGTTGTDYGRSIAYRDQNRVPIWLGTSSADGVTPVEIYGLSTGALLIKST